MGEIAIIMSEKEQKKFLLWTLNKIRNNMAKEDLFEVETGYAILNSLEKTNPTALNLVSRWIGYFKENKIEKCLEMDNVLNALITEIEDGC